MKNVTILTTLKFVVILAGCTAEKRNNRIYTEPHSMGVVQVTTVGNIYNDPPTEANISSSYEQALQMCEDWGFQRSFRDPGENSRMRCLDQYCANWESIMKLACMK